MVYKTTLAELSRWTLAVLNKLTFVLKAKNIWNVSLDVSFLKSGWLDQNISRGFFKLPEAMTLYLWHKESRKST